MSPRARPPCVVCGSTVRVEQNHLAGRANDPGLTVPMCRPCHQAFTDWQWRLGILRHETPIERADHEVLERAWALVEGFVVTACLSPPAPDTAPAVALGRAAAALLAMVDLATGGEPRWGPKPAMRKGSAEPSPRARGKVGLADFLRLTVAVTARLGATDQRLDRIVRAADVIADQVASIEQRGSLAWTPELVAMAGRAIATIAAIGAVDSLDDLLNQVDELQHLASFADQTLRLLDELAGAASLQEAVEATASLTGGYP